MYNSTDKDLFISYDGIDDHDIIPSNENFNPDFCLPKFSLIYVRCEGKCPKKGHVYLSMYFVN